MGKIDLPVLRGERVVLRAPTDDDVAARLRLGNNPDLIRLSGGSRADVRPMTEEEARRWVQHLRDHDYAWVIERGALIGAVRLDHVDLRDRRASLEIGIEEKARLGLGLGTEAIMLVLGYAFDSLNLHRISVRVIDYNTRALRAYEKCGFVVEGREREGVYVDGTWHDDVLLGILEREYAERKRSRGPPG